VISLRRRVLVLAITTSSLALIVAGWSTYSAFRRFLTSEFDIDLAVRARVLATLAPTLPDPAMIALGLRLDDGDEAMIAVTDGHGRLLLRSGPPTTWTMIAGPDPIPPVAAGPGQVLVPVHGLTMPDGQHGRGGVWSVQVAGPGQQQRPLLVALAMATAHREAALHRLSVLMAGILAGISVGMGLIMAAAVHHALQPLSRLARSLASMDDRSLGRPLILDPPTRELAPVVDHLRALLGRLERAFTAEKMVTAAIAHELRTPLAGLISTLDVALSKERSAADSRQALHTSHMIAGQMRTLVERLLLLARLASGSVLPVRRDTDLAALVASAWRPLQAMADRRSVAFSVQWEGPIAVQSDPDWLGMVCTNLLENAVTYVDAGGWIRVTGGRGTEGMRLSVANSGCTIGGSDAAMVFQRFWRGDSARNDTGLHCGLGLAICHDIMRALAGRIEARSDGGIFTITVTLPQGAPLIAAR
jgi:two-component system heavy metal sensor histidine kinase CusS